ncbi:MFS transporter [Coraliomargarita parva]|uniref:MFS transporter n=1 Tax=Coraliomargarita parva TaxID=3014050 RepID=UPI0022B41852|nr:MFS transporter [Coraliomargarita parva]
MPPWVEVAYRKVTGGNQSSASNGISEDAAKVVAPNFFIQVLASVATKTGDQLLSPRLVLTWLLASIHAPAAAVSLLVPVREAFALLPQVLVGAQVQRSAIRKWYWVGGSICQGLCVFGIVWVATQTSSPDMAGWACLALLGLFSGARVFNSISGKDLMGKTLPKRQRGIAGGTASAVAGGSTLVVALYFMTLEQAKTDPADIARILQLAGSFWFVGAVLFRRLREFPSPEVDTDQAIWQQAFAGFDQLRSNRDFRNFVAARTGLIGNALVLPLIVLDVFKSSEGRGFVLGALMAASGLAALCSGFIWGKLADRSSRRVLVSVGLGGAGIALAAILVRTLSPAGPLQTVLLGIAFFLFAIIHQGTRIARKTYLIDLAHADDRATLVAVSNTVIGINLLLVGACIGYLTQIDPRWAIAGCAAFSLMGGLLAMLLPEVEAIPDT